ncbi:putative sugar nucleotidyl transferase [Leadbetterella sp. DM7]|uniref:putative sugar nucleotidyl transferase n=1 Tax=Leadbetterella sp. DM7 TaxID=3235085 RepID=UPI00349ED392
MNLILFDTPEYRDFLKPLTLTRPVAGLRCGVLTLTEKWEQRLNSPASFLTEEYLKEKFPARYTADNLYVNASCLPDAALVRAVRALNTGESIYAGNDLIALRTADHLDYGFEPAKKGRAYEEPVSFVRELPHLFLNNGPQIEVDYALLSANRPSEKITDPHTAIYREDRVFTGSNVQVRAAIINAEAGPVYIDDDAIIQEGAIIIGPVAIGRNAMVAFGAKIRSNTTIGPFCRVGGEVGNSVFHAYSNKAHDGFLGNSYIGEWCNLGANTNNSNLKNNYKSVSLYSYALNGFYDTGEIFCGTFLGDYTKAGISTMFNTGTVAGVCSNIYGSGFQEKFIPGFTWGGKAEGYQPYRFDKAVEVIGATMSRRSQSLDGKDLNILKYIAENRL